MKPLVAVTMGDAAGIGPEIVVRALTDGSARLHEHCRAIVLGDAAVMRAAAALIGADVSVFTVDGPGDLDDAPPGIAVLQTGRPFTTLPRPGEVHAECGAAAVAAVMAAAALARDGLVDGIATAPLNKEAMRAAGYGYPGHTELLAEQLGATRFSLALGADGLYLLHVTTHVSLREACERITSERVLSTIELADELAHALGRENTEIAVLGLNPHAGENRLFGHEDADHIAPAIVAAKGRGIRAVGPLPADAALPQAFQGRYSIVVAMYHDQGHVAFKAVYGDRGINVTVGLPTVRTSVDHGTAFDIAGQGSARHDSMVRAIQLAAELAPAWRRKWRSTTSAT